MKGINWATGLLILMFSCRNEPKPPDRLTFRDTVIQAYLANDTNYLPRFQVTQEREKERRQCRDRGGKAVGAGADDGACVSVESGKLSVGEGGVLGGDRCGCCGLFGVGEGVRAVIYHGDRPVENPVAYVLRE
jgi:hypothetical protein